MHELCDGTDLLLSAGIFLEDGAEQELVGELEQRDHLWPWRI